MKIILIGFMGSGKSAVAAELAHKLGWAKVEMDELALKKSRRKDVNAVFNQDGEARWRELEIATTKKLRNVDNIVISTGGGVVMNQIIFSYLKNKPQAVVIYLAAEFATLRRRLRGDKTRPLFSNIKKAQRLYELREPLYRHYADITITTGKRTPTAIAQEIIKKYISIT